jgi:tetratricopeptide (TPR) repeat protein
MGENLRLLAMLWVRPGRAMSAIIDEGSLLFGAVAVLAVSALTGAAMYHQVSPTYMLFVPTVAPSATAPPGWAPGPGEPEDFDETDIAEDPARYAPALLAASFFSATLTMGIVFVLALLYAPFVLVLLTVFESIGSFGVAFRRDFGPFLACTFMAFAATRLPVALIALLAPGLEVMTALWIASLVYFTALVALAARVVFGVGRGSAYAAATLGWGAVLLHPFLVFLASPFLLYFAYQFLRGDVGDVLWSFGARQSFNRYLEAATINPRDAEAHYQLGLIHLQRRQLEEAVARFTRAVEIDPREVDAHYQLGLIAREQRRFEDARRHFDAVVSRDERHASHEIWREVGATYLESESYEHARWALAKYVEQRPHDAEGIYLLGMALHHLGQEEPAREMFRRCVEAVDTTPRYLRRKAGRWRKLALQQLGTNTMAP